MNITIYDVIDYLNYPNEFWKYIKNITEVINDPYQDFENSMWFYGVWNNRIVIPKVMDLFTAKVALHEFKHYYEMFYGIKRTNEDYEIEARKEEYLFEEYIKARKK